MIQQGVCLTGYLGVFFKKLRRVLGCVLGGILGSVLRADLGVYSQQAGRAIKCKWSILRVCLGVCLKASWELPWEAKSGSWECAIKWNGSVLESYVEK